MKTVELEELQGGVVFGIHSDMHPVEISLLPGLLKPRDQLPADPQMAKPGQNEKGGQFSEMPPFGRFYRKRRQGTPMRHGKKTGLAYLDVIEAAIQPIEPSRISLVETLQRLDNLAAIEAIYRNQAFHPELSNTFSDPFLEN